jgi:hypothetical protein
MLYLILVEFIFGNFKATTLETELRYSLNHPQTGGGGALCIKKKDTLQVLCLQPTPLTRHSEYTFLSSLSFFLISVDGV